MVSTTNRGVGGRCAGSARRSGSNPALGLSPSDPARPGLLRFHQADNRTTASTATLRTTVAIPATSMLVIRLDAMHHSWRQLSGSVDLDHAVALTHPPFRPVLSGGSLGRQAASARARPSFRTALTDVTIPSQVGFKLFDDDPKQTRGKWISNLPRQKLIMRDLNFLLSELALCHELCPPTNRRRGYTIVSLKFSDHFLWFLSSKLCLLAAGSAKLGSCVFVDLVLRPRRR
jgi:hypothetical protein